MSQTYEEKIQKTTHDSLSVTSTVEMCKFCFDVIINQLLKGERKGSIFDIESSIKSPLFVTWEINKNGIYNLRGCIGTLAPQQICLALGEYAKTSAFKDPRFHPITLHEVSLLRVSVSLLVQYEDCDNCLDWTPGVHGVIINFAHSSKNYSATYLPEVAAEQGWSQLEAIKSLVKKSGFLDPLTEEIKIKIRCTRYQSSKNILSYETYAQMEGAVSVEQSDITPDDAKTGKWFGSF